MAARLTVQPVPWLPAWPASPASWLPAWPASSASRLPAWPASPASRLPAWPASSFIKSFLAVEIVRAKQATKAKETALIRI